MKWLNAISTVTKTLSTMYKTSNNKLVSILNSIVGLWVYLGFMLADIVIFFLLEIFYSPLEILGFMKTDSGITGEEPHNVQISKIVFNAIGTIVFSPFLFACFGLLIPAIFITMGLDICAWFISAGACKFDIMKTICNG